MGQGGIILRWWSMLGLAAGYCDAAIRAAASLVPGTDDSKPRLWRRPPLANEVLGAGLGTGARRVSLRRSSLGGVSSSCDWDLAIGKRSDDERRRPRTLLSGLLASGESRDCAAARAARRSHDDDEDD